MEARSFRTRRSCCFLSLLFVILVAAPVQGAGFRTPNFTVDAPTAQLAKEIGDTAEHWRQKLAQEWIGKELPNWSKPCPIKARVAPNLGAGGATSFIFDQGEVFGWRMNIQGSRERILDSVVPHEVLHTIFASHFRQPVPRWADEGACTTVEHHSEINKQEQMLIQFLQTRRGIPFSDMFAMKEYPSDVLPLYAQGHSLAKFLIAQRGKREFLAFLADGMTDDNWPRALRDRYGYHSLLVLQQSWEKWVGSGRPQLELAADADTDMVLVADYETPASETPVIRGQDPQAGQVIQASATVDQNWQSPQTNLSQNATQPWAPTISQPTVRQASTSSQPGRSVYDTRGRVAQ